MYIYQNGKLYVSLGDNKIVGVEIYFDKVVIIDGTETELDEHYQVLSKREVVAGFHIDEENPYLFPIEKKRVEENDSTGNIEKPNRGRPATKRQ